MTQPGAMLDDPDGVARSDPSGMLLLAAALGNQLRDGFTAARGVPGLPSGDGLRHVVVSGMGGSGVAGDVLRSLYADRLSIPVVVSKGYALPEFCGRDTLVLAGSFSGNTEETLSAYREAVIRGCRMVAMSSGGELAELARQDLVPLVPIPTDVPVPRAALGYLASGPIGVLEAMGVIPPVGSEVERAARLLDGLAGRLGADRLSDDNPAKALALWLEGRTPVIWGSEGLAEAPALRWKAEFNENAKVPAFWAVLPELDHNEVEGWSPGAGSGYGLIVLRHRSEHPRVVRRVAATLEALQGSGLEARQVHAEGSSPLEQLLSLVMVGDFTATYLGILRGVDPTPIPVLSALKERLRT